MRAAFWILKRGPGTQEIKELNLYLKKLGKLLGRVRDADLALVDAKNYHINVKELKVSQVILKKKILKMIGTHQLNELKSRLAAASNLAANISPSVIAKAREELVILMDSRIDKKFRGAKKLHRLRIDMKKARYILEAVGEPIEPLKPLQDVLGEAHDLQILRDLVGKSKILKSKESLLNKKALRLVKPALQFTVAQLKSRNSKTDFTKHEIAKNGL